MGILSRFENRMEDGLEGAADRFFDAPISPVQIAKKAEKQMRREKMVGAGKQYAPTLYTVLVNRSDDDRLFGYYPTLAGETETYLSAQAASEGLTMDGQPLVRFIVDESLKPGKFEVIAELVAAPIVSELRAEEMERYGLASNGGFVQSPYAAQAAAPRAQRGRGQGAYGQAPYQQQGFDQGQYAQQDFGQAPYGQQGAYAQDAYNQQGFAPDPYGQDPYAQQGYDQNAFDQPAYGQGYDQGYDQAYDQGEFGQADYRQDFGQPAYDQQDFGQDFGQPAYDQQGFGQDFGQDPYGQQDFGRYDYADPYENSIDEWNPGFPGNAAAGAGMGAGAAGMGAAGAGAGAAAAAAAGAAARAAGAQAPLQGIPQTMVFGAVGSANPAMGQQAQPYPQQPQAALFNRFENRSYPLPAPRAVIGRSTTSDVVVNDANASRTHAELLMDGSGNWIVRDLNSTNGLYVNKRRVQQVSLRDGDIITIGASDFEFFYE